MDSLTVNLGLNHASVTSLLCDSGQVGFVFHKNNGYKDIDDLVPVV